MATEIISIEPATGAQLWRGQVGDVDAEVELARAAWAGWAAQSVTVRTEMLRRFVTLLRAEGEAMADLTARETGKPLWEARTEIDGAAGRIELAARSYAERTAQRRFEAPMNASSAVRHKPLGTLAVIGPFCNPWQLAVASIVPALMAGNSVVYKPSEKTPACGAAIIRLLHAAGVPSGVVRLLIGGGDTGRALAVHPGIDGVLFTGSTATGLGLARALVNRPDRLLTLAMGGNNPIVVWDTPDVHAAAVLVVQSAFLSAGQRCASARRLIVRDAIADRLLAEVRLLANRLIVAEPHSMPVPYMGPVIDNDAADGITESFLILMSNGGKVVRHMTRPIAGRPFLTPGIIDVTDLAERPDVELFGPLLQVVRVDDFDTAIAEANNSVYGLTAALVGGTPQLYDQFWAHVRAGVINWNRPTTGTSPSAPLGGLGLSGNHRPGAWYMADHCAYPVASTETEQARASIGIGLRDTGAAGVAGVAPADIIPPPRPRVIGL